MSQHHPDYLGGSTPNAVPYSHPPTLLAKDSTLCTNWSWSTSQTHSGTSDQCRQNPCSRHQGVLVEQSRSLVTPIGLTFDILEPHSTPCTLRARWTAAAPLSISPLPAPPLQRHARAEALSALRINPPSHTPPYKATGETQQILLTLMG